MAWAMRQRNIKPELEELLLSSHRGHANGLENESIKTSSYCDQLCHCCQRQRRKRKIGEREPFCLKFRVLF